MSSAQIARERLLWITSKDRLGNREEKRGASLAGMTCMMISYLRPETVIGRRFNRQVPFDVPRR